MNTENKISIVMPTYNAAAYIGEAIDSILNQSFGDFEIIIVDDSKDNTDEIVALYKDPRIKFIRNANKVGISNARNQAIGMASGDLIAFHDADDISKPNRFEKQLAFLSENPNIAMLGGGCDVLRVDGTIEKDKLPPKSPSVKMQIRKNCFRTSSVIIRADALTKVGLFNSCIDYAEDWELWIRVGKQFKVANLGEVFFTYRETRHGISAQEQGNHILWDTLVHSIAMDSISDEQLQQVKQNGIGEFEKIIPKAARVFYHRKCYRQAKKERHYKTALTHCDALNEYQGFTIINWFRKYKLKRQL